MKSHLCVRTEGFDCDAGVQSTPCLFEGIPVKSDETMEDKRILQERLLVQQTRMAAMGELVGAIAHQWRQPLNALAIMIQNMQDAYEYDDLTPAFMEETIQYAMQQINYMSQTIDDFRNFFRCDEPDQLFDVRKTVDDVVILLSGLFVNHGISIQLKNSLPADSPVWIMGCCNEFKQAIFNLLMNAHDAIQQRRTRGDLNGQGRVGIAIDRGRNDLVNITVSDNGGGIPDKIADRIFDPYFTTKEVGKGSGVGLYMAKTIIENHMKGSLYARNLDEGAVFTVELVTSG